MAEPNSGSSNEAQIEFWNGEAAQTWVRAQEQMDLMLAPLSDAAVARADPRTGERALDVGCGCGSTSIALGQRGAEVLGVDVSEPMLERARAQAAGMANVKFTRADAAVMAFESDHGLIFSRFGVMFFSEPVAAFANLHRALSEDGRMVFLCWQAPAVNPWVSVAGRVLQPFLPEAAPTDPKAPGPFAFADDAYLAGILQAAGFSRVEIEPLTGTLRLGDDVASAMEFQTRIGPMARVLTELEGEVRDQAIDAVRKALEEHLTPDGLELGAATWLVSATAR